MTLHDALYTIYIILCIFHYSDMLITKYGPPLRDWWKRRQAPQPLPRMDERQVWSRTPDTVEAKAVRRSTRRLSTTSNQ
jgi:hypothetical protein